MSPVTHRRILGLLLVLFMVATACGSAESDETTTSPSEPEASAVTEETTSPTDTAVTNDESPTDESNNDADEDHADEDHADEDHDHDDESSSLAGGAHVDLFMDGALVGEPTIDDCTLADGSTSQCYTITVTGTPVNHSVGPFCATNVTDGPEAGGLWLDGENSYEIDGEFFTELAEIYGDDLWNNLVNEDGSINVIDNAADFQVAARPDITEEFYYHCVDGNVEWLDSGEQPTSTIQVPVTPVATDSVTVEFATGAHSTLGVTFNGAALSGSADMTAILASYTIAAFDDCGGHINPALGYHVHGTAGCADVEAATTGDGAPFAMAIDGHTVHAPVEGVELDECNGHTSDEYGYHYHANPIDQNATLTCVTGLVAEGQDAGRPGGNGERPPRPEDE